MGVTSIILVLAVFLAHVPAMARTCNPLFADIKKETPKTSALLSHKLETIENSKGNVLLIHGLGDDLAGLAKTAQSLKKAGYSVLRIELNAHGKNLDLMVQENKSVPNLIPYQKNVEDIIKLLHALKFKHAHIVGHSYGGAIAYSLTNSLKGEYKAQSLAMLAPYLRRLDHSLLTGNPIVDMPVEYATEQHMRKAYREYFESLGKPHIEELVNAAVATTKGIRSFDILSYGKKAAPQLKMPFLIVGGTKDEAIKPDHIETLQKKLIEEKYDHQVIMVEGDHFFPQNAANETSKVLKAFIERQ